jgi:putative ABC transport system permease protein
MRLTSFVVFRSWASNRLRTALTVLGIALGIAIVVAIHVVDHNTIQSRLRQQRADFGRVDLELLSHVQDRDPAETRASLAARPEVRDVGLWRQALVAVQSGERHVGTCMLYGISPLPSRAFGHYVVDEGEDLDDLGGDSAVLVGRAYADANGWKVGDLLTLSIPPATLRARCRNGVLEQVPEVVTDPRPHPVRIAGILAPQRVGRRHLGEVFVGSFALARRLAPAAPTFFQINRQPGANVDRLRQSLQADHQVLDERSALLGEAADERAFRNGVKILGCLALVLGMFVVFQTLSQSLVERLRQLGLLRCLGAGRSSIAAIFLLDAVVMAVVGAVLGVAMGLALAYGLQSMEVSTLGMGKVVDTFEIPPGPVLWTATIGVLFTLAGAAFPLWKARNLPAMAILAAHGLDGSGNYVLRGVHLFLFVLLVVVLPGAYLAMTPLLAEDGHETLVVLAELGSMILLFGGVLLAAPFVVQTLARLMLLPLRPFLRLPVFLVDKALKQNPGRFAASVCGLAVVLVALVALKHVTYSLAGEVRRFGAITTSDRVFVAWTSHAPLSRSALEGLGQIPGVRSFDAIEGTVNPSFLLSGLDAAALVRDGRALAGEPLLAQRYREERCLIVSHRLAQLRGFRVDDFVAVLTDDGPVPYRVLRISDASGFFPDERAFAVTDPRWLRQDFCLPVASVVKVSIEVTPGHEHHELMSTVQRELPFVDWKKSGPDIVAYHLRDVARDFRLFDLLLFLILVLAGVGLVNAMTIAALGRSREIGVLRALGTDGRALQWTFLLEGVVVALLAAGLACALGAPLGSVVVAGLRQVSGLDVPLVVPWAVVAAVPFVALAVGLVASILPGLRAVRERPSDAVRYE